MCPYYSESGPNSNTFYSILLHNADMTEKNLPQTVQEAIDQYAAFYSARDIDGILSITSPGFLGFGSGPDEAVYSADEYIRALKRDFSQSDEIRMTFTELHIREDIRAAWMLANCTITAKIHGDLTLMEGRMTAVFRRITTGWQVAMTHFSMAYTGQEAGHSFTTAKKE